MSNLDSSLEIPKRCRPFGLLDGMLLIAAIALWMVGLKIWLKDGGDFTSAYWSGALVAVDGGILYLLAVVLLSAFYLSIRIRPPRLSWRRWIVQPGMLICLSVPATYFISGFFEPGSVASAVEPDSLTSEYAVRSYLLSASIGCAWGAACFNLRSTIEVGWIERLGRVVGLGWVGIGLVNLVMLSLR